HLDHVPAGAGEQRFELLDDLPVAAHRAVQALQIAVDDERQVVEAFASSERESSDRSRLVDLAVAEHTPHAAIAGGHETAMVEVAHETRLVDRADRAEPHRAGRELPGAPHAPLIRMRV